MMASISDVLVEFEKEHQLLQKTNPQFNNNECNFGQMLEKVKTKMRPGKLTKKLTAVIVDLLQELRYNLRLLLSENYKEFLLGVRSTLLHCTNALKNLEESPHHKVLMCHCVSTCLALAISLFMVHLPTLFSNLDDIIEANKAKTTLRCKSSHVLNQFKASLVVLNELNKEKEIKDICKQLDICETSGFQISLENEIKRYSTSSDKSSADYCLDLVEIYCDFSTFRTLLLLHVYCSLTSNDKPGAICFKLWREMESHALQYSKVTRFLESGDLSTACVATRFSPGNWNSIDSRDNAIKTSLSGFPIPSRNPLVHLATRTHKIIPHYITGLNEKDVCEGNPRLSVSSGYLTIQNTYGRFKFTPTDDGYWHIQSTQKDSFHKYIYVDCSPYGYLQDWSSVPGPSGEFKLSPVKGENNYIVTSKKYPDHYVGAYRVNNKIYLSSCYTWPAKNQDNSHFPIIWHIP